MSGPTIVFERRPDPDQSIWRAFLANADHIGGTGRTPEEALGWLVFNHPTRCGVAEFTWKNTPPNPGHGEEWYPAGKQEIYGC